VRSRWLRNRPLRVFMPVSMSVALIALSIVAADVVALALTSVAAVVTAATVLLHMRAASEDQERIANLQAALPRLTTAVDHEAALHLAPKPSTVMGEVLRHQKPTVSLGAATPMSIPRSRIDLT
jgi:hypothetical protein